MTLAPLAPVDDFGTTALDAVYRVFVWHPVTGDHIDMLSTDDLYTGSALANHLCDQGYRVETDMWGPDGYAAIPDAMVSPAVWEGYQLGRFTKITRARALLVCTVCSDMRPDADIEREGVSKGARCTYMVCEGVYTDPRY